MGSKRPESKCFKSIVKVHFANETVLRKRHAVYCSSIMNAFMILEHFNLHHTTPIIFQTVFFGFFEVNDLVGKSLGDYDSVHFKRKRPT